MAADTHKDTLTRYSRWSMLLHWISALLVFGLFASGLWQVRLSYYDPLYKTLPHYHKSVGIVLGCLVLIRLLLRWLLPRVEPLPGMSARQRLAVTVGHMALYANLLLVILLGIGISTADGRSIEVFNWFSIPALPWQFEQQEVVLGNLHEWGAYGLMALVAGHVLMSVVHGKQVLKRMLLWF